MTYFKHIFIFISFSAFYFFGNANDCNISKQLGRMLALDFSKNFPNETFVGLIKLDKGIVSIVGCEGCLAIDLERRLVEVIREYIKISKCEKISNSSFLIPLIFGRNTNEVGRMKLLIDPIEAEKLLSHLKSNKEAEVLDTISFYFNPFEEKKH